MRLNQLLSEINCCQSRLFRTAPCLPKPMSNVNCCQSRYLEQAHACLSQSRPAIVRSRWDPTWERRQQDKKDGGWLTMWLYLHLRRAVMAAQVLAAGDDTSNSSSRWLIVLALENAPANLQPWSLTGCLQPVFCTGCFLKNFFRQAKIN